MQPFRTEAIILRRTNYGEADRILNMLTPERGKISTIAKGVRKPKSKLAGGLELFAVCDITCHFGRGEMAVVTSARMQRFFGNILHDYERMQLGYAMIKDINKAAETVSEPEFYELLKSGLTFLDTLDIEHGLIELWFRLQLALLLGHGLNVVTDMNGERLSEEARYRYDFDEHAFVVHAAGQFGAEHIKVLRLAIARTPVVLAHVRGVEAVVDECLWLVRGI